MFPKIPSGLSLTRIITGVSKSLSIANQVIPLYEQMKPMVTNARKAFSILKEINLKPNQNTSNNSSKNASNNNNNNNVENNQIKKIATNQRINSNFNNPSFFK